MRTRRLKAKTTRLSRRSALIALVLASALAASAIAVAATSGSTAPTPIITSAPANPTTQTSASFTYRDSQATVTFQCQLDASGFSACSASGMTYSGPLADGDHTFKVRAVAGGKTSSAASYTWTIDTKAPEITLAFPANNGTYREDTWNAGCAGAPGLCGEARDPTGVKSVVVSIRQGSGNWWGGSSFNQTSEYFSATTLAAPGAASTKWSYQLPMPTN